MAGGRLTKPELWLAFMLAACGGRTLDDGAYEAPGGSSHSDQTCSYQGVTVVNGALVADPCVCACDNGHWQCQAGCDGPGSGASGASFGGGAAVAGAPAIAGAPSVAGAPSSGASSGGATSGGAVGIAGAPTVACGPVLRATGQQPLIDDMEDGDGGISRLEGRSGGWFTYNDGTPGAVQSPPPSAMIFPMLADLDPLGGGHYVAGTNGSGFTTWGAGMGLVLTSGGCPYDASAYIGVRIFARADRPTPMYVMLPTADTNPPSAGGTCQELTGHSCFDSYQTQILLDRTWQTFHIDYLFLSQQGWGQAFDFDPRKLIGINFQIPNDGAKFSIEVDDVTFD